MYPAQFAAVYDRLMDDVDYPSWAAYYLALLNRARGGAPLGRVCECGCGTGSMTVELARTGLEMVGVDLSAPMLEIAGEKLRRNGLCVPLVCQDMCRFNCIGRWTPWSAPATGSIIWWRMVKRPPFSGGLTPC